MTVILSKPRDSLVAEACSPPALPVEKIKSDALNREEGEDHLLSLIKQAGDEARIRRKRVLEEHFKKLEQVISEAVSRMKESVSE